MSIPLVSQTIPQKTFNQRRNALLQSMKEGIAFIKSPSVSVRNSDIAYDFRTSSDFYYITGLEESDAICVLIPEAEKKCILFVRPANTFTETWVGKTAGIKGAMETYGADTAFAITQFRKMLPDYVSKYYPIYYSSQDMNFRKRLSEETKKNSIKGKRKRVKTVPYIHDMRLIKGPEEISLLTQAATITSEALKEVMRAAEPGMYEFELQAIIEYTFRKNGSIRNGFPSIVGSGPNSTVLHYVQNDRQTEQGDLVCMDVGAEYHYYTADITRTIPVNGHFTSSQRDIYDIVLQANKEAIAMTAPGISISDIYRHSSKILRLGLKKLGLITDINSRWQARIWTPHGIGHWLGMDAHDVAGKGLKNGQLKAGVAFTIEPGIYIKESILENLENRRGMQIDKEELKTFIQEVKPVVEKYNNIGIRIEDDILVTETGYQNLSEGTPKEINEIEKLMAEKSYLNR
jgi:Xaa-Pro aminopeptidase